MAPLGNTRSLGLRRRALAAVSCVLSLAGCNFAMEEPAMEQNSCVVDSDCATQSCEAGRCVTGSDQAIKIALFITPKNMPDGSQGTQLVSAPFALKGGDQAVSLQQPLAVPVSVHNGQAIAAQVTFTPLKAANPFTAKGTTLNTIVPLFAQSEPNNRVLLQDGTDYKVLVQPADATLPSHSLPFTATAGATLDVDYTEISWQRRLYAVRNAPDGAYTMRARAPGGGPILSNSVQLSGGNALVTLQFDPSDSPYELEFVSADQHTYSDDASDCGGSMPKPSFTIDGSKLVQDRTLFEPWVVDFPDLPDPVAYSGQVDLCPNQRFTGDLPISIKSTSLQFGATKGAITGKYELASAASWDNDAQVHKFCAMLMPGDYTVVVTPPATVGCQVFAERRTLKAQSGNTDDELSLRTPTTLNGRVTTPDLMPMANATIDLAPLGISDIMLAQDDRSVPLYNRTRQVTTTANGGFTLPVDVGSYDVTVKPPAQSNYAWRILYGVDVGTREAQFTTVVNLTAPVVIKGKIGYQNGSSRDQSTLASADVHAYALVDEGKPNERPIEVARGSADAMGGITLLMPPQLQKSWIPE
jgi:hypothetical protein